MIAITMHLAMGGAIQAGVGLKSFSVASSMVAEEPCEASTADEVRSCIANIRSGTANAIHIRAMISCSTANECNFPLNGLPSATSASSISIYGDGNGLTGFKRTDHYDYSIFVVPYSKRIKFSGLTFDDTAVEVSGPYSPISLYYATDIEIANNKFFGSKFAAITISNVSRVQIVNNTIDSSQTYHIWGGDADQVYIRGNTFLNSYANAILAGFYNSKIVQNEFKNNHHEALWGVSGGQIDIVDVTNHLYVGCNNIHDSSIPGYPNAVGVELAPTHIHNVELVGNSIYNHDGYAVSINYGNSNFGNIYIHNNSASNNGISPVTHMQYDYNDFTPTLVNNCSNTSCLVSCDYTIDSIFYDDFE